MLEERLKYALKQFKLVPESHIDYTLGKLLQAIKEAGYLLREEWGKHVDEKIVGNPYKEWLHDPKDSHTVDMSKHFETGMHMGWNSAVQATKKAIKEERDDTNG